LIFFNEKEERFFLLNIFIYRISISIYDIMYERNILLGFMRVHILHHAAHEGIYGVEMIEELATHGYTISPGTLYPILHEMKKNELLTVQNRNVDGKIRKIYSITSKGKQILEQLKKFVKELSEEVIT